MLGLILGVSVILLGAKAFTEKGIPLTKGKNLTGFSAKTIGIICFLLGIVFVADGIFASFKVIHLLSGG